MSFTDSGIIKYGCELCRPGRFQFCGKIIVECIETRIQGDRMIAAWGDISGGVRYIRPKGKAAAFRHGKLGTRKGCKNAVLGISGRS